MVELAGEVLEVGTAEDEGGGMAAGQEGRCLLEVGTDVVAPADLQVAVRVEDVVVVDVADEMLGVAGDDGDVVPCSASSPIGRQS